MGVRLPAEYQEVEYIESKGAQYFFTDIPIQDNLTVDSVQTFNGGDTYLFGGYTDTGFRICFNGYYASHLQSSYNGYYSWGSVNPDNTTKYHVVQTQKYGMQIGYVDGTQKLSSARTGMTPSGSGYCVAFGQRQQAGTVNEKYYGKVYSLKVLQDTKLLANYIPCYRKSDGEIGMYDLVLQKFYTNEGTGVFLKGNDVIDSISPLMVAWRRGLMGCKKTIGYTANIGFNPYGTSITQQEGHFITGFIPFDLSNGAINATGRWGGTYSSGAIPFMVFYDEDKNYLNYYSMTPTATGERTVTCSVKGTKFIRFHGYMEYIDECYFRDNTHNVILWQKGM